MDKMAAIFPGQGSHLVGMYQGIYDEYQIVKDTIDEAEKVLKKDIKKLCFQGGLGELSKAENAHVAILAFGVAAFRVMVSELGYLPEFCAGHSLGEYAALVCAGVMKFSDALKIVELRARIGNKIIKEKQAGMTIVDQTDVTQVEEVCAQLRKEGKEVYIACYNSDVQVAISGLNQDLMLAENIIREKTEAVISPLLVSAPFHSPLMEGGVEELRQVIENTELRDFQIPVLSNYTGLPYRSLEEVKVNLAKHITSPVKWMNIIQYIQNHRINCMIDMSANNVFKIQLEGMVHDGVQTICFSNKLHREELFTKYREDEKYSRIKSNMIHRCLVAAVATKNHNWDNTDYNERVVKRYQLLEKMREKYITGDLVMDKQIKKDLIGTVKEIFEGKGVSEKEQNFWIWNILNFTGNVYLLENHS